MILLVLNFEHVHDFLNMSSIWNAFDIIRILFDNKTQLSIRLFIIDINHGDLNNE